MLFRKKIMLAKTISKKQNLSKYALVLLVPLFFVEAKPSAIKANTTKTITIALGSDPGPLDPLRATSAGGMRLVNLLFQSLVKLDPELKVKPGLAKSWTYKNKTYTFVISRFVEFSNGRRLKKQDLLFSFKEWRSDKTPFASAFKIIESIQVKENKQNFILTIKLKKASAKFLASDLPVLKILPKKETLLAGKDFYKNPIGTGPFRLQSANSREVVLLSWQNTTPSQLEKDHKPSNSPTPPTPLK